MNELPCAAFGDVRESGASSGRVAPDDWAPAVVAALAVSDAQLEAHAALLEAGYRSSLAECTPLSSGQ